MAKPFVGIGVAIVDRVLVIVFSSVIVPGQCLEDEVCEINPMVRKSVRELYDALSISPVLAVRDTVWTVESQEVQAKLGIRVIKFIDKLHAQVLVELDAAFGVFDPLRFVSFGATSQELGDGTSMEWLSLYLDGSVMAASSVR